MSPVVLVVGTTILAVSSTSARVMPLMVESIVSELTAMPPPPSDRLLV